MFSTDITILVVDDMLTMRKIVSKSLKDMGYKQIIEAPDGQKAWEVLNQPDCAVKLVVSDWNMPNCTGLDLLKRVRKDNRTKDLSFILLTAESEQSQVVEAIKEGVDGYIRKPFTNDILKGKIQDIYKKKFGNAA